MIRTMRSVRAAFVGAVMAGSFAPALFAQAKGDERYVGTWVGALQTPAMKLRLALTVARDGSGALSGFMTSIDQGNARIPGTLTVTADSLTIRMPAVSARYTAVIAGDSLVGTFNQGLPLPLNLGRGTLPTIVHSQEPKAPFPYATEDVSFESVPGVRLAGTISMPPGAGPFPAVVLVTGSGPQDRNEELLGHKPFLVIADYLARHGIASLRYDDRGTAKSTGNFAAGTSDDFAKDAEAAVKFLTTKKGIARNHIGVMGHSEGGLIAPIVATRSKDVAFIVLLAGPGLPGDTILLMQQELIAESQGVPQATIERAGAANSRMFAEVRAAKDSADAVARLATVTARMVALVPEGERALATTQLAEAQKQLVAPWMMYFLKYDPRPTLRQVRVPVLALNGSMDLQVPPKQDLAAIEAALKAGGNKDFTVTELPGLNHLFQTTKTGNPAEYGSIDETFSPTALAAIADWINAHVRK
jgi:uncharacterized protein